MKIKHITQIFILIAAMMLFTAPSYAAYDPSLVGYWKLDETAGGTAYDSTTNDNDGAIDGPTMGAAGQYGTAYDFDGDGDKITINDGSNLSICMNYFKKWNFNKY